MPGEKIFSAAYAEVSDVGWEKLINFWTFSTPRLTSQLYNQLHARTKACRRKRFSAFNGHVIMWDHVRL